MTLKVEGRLLYSVDAEDGSDSCGVHYLVHL